MLFRALLFGVGKLVLDRLPTEIRCLSQWSQNNLDVLSNRDRPRLVKLVGHQTTNTSIGN